MQKQQKTKNRDRSYQLTIPEEDLLEQQLQWNRSKSRKAVMPKPQTKPKSRFRVNREEELIPIVSASDGMRWYVISCDDRWGDGEYLIERINPSGQYVTNLRKRYKKRSAAVDAALDERDRYQLMLDEQEGTLL